MSVTLAGGRRCLVCGHASFLTVHRACSRRISARAATSQGRKLAGRGPQHAPSAEVAALPAKFAIDARSPRPGVLPHASMGFGSSSFAASLLDQPSDGDPNARAAVRRSELIAGPCRVRRDLRHF